MIKIRLHRNELNRLNACPEGMKLFESLQKRGVFCSNWTQLHAVWAAVTWPDFVGWMVTNGLLPIANLSGADLYGANLSGANLSGVYNYTLPEGWEIINGIAQRKQSK
jgi:uncharacterized protein YjbI with pentapeptide repeats